MKKIVIGVSITIAVILIIVVSFSVGNLGTSSPTISSPTPVTPTSNATLPPITSHRHFDISLDEKMKFKT